MSFDRLGMIIIHGGRFFSKIEELGLRRAEYAVIAAKYREMLHDFIKTSNIPFSAHCPMVVPDNYHENPLLGAVLDFDVDRRKAAQNMMIESMNEAADLGAEYAVVHLQRPEFFGGPNPSDASVQNALDIAKRGCEELLEKSIALNLPLYVENLMDNSLFNSPDSYVELFREFPELGFCLDLGHLEVDSRKFEFSMDEFIDATISRIKAVHLQNSEPGQLDFKTRHWKVPVHPQQDIQAGWMDIESILNKILTENRNCAINFEARVDEIYNFDYMREGIEWIKEMLPRLMSTIT